MAWPSGWALRRAWKWARAICTPPSGCEAESLGALAKAQATGDLVTLAARGRRCLHLHLPDNSGVTLRALASVVNEVLDDLVAQRAGAHAS